MFTMSGYPKSIKNVISEFKKLPGIGRRSAERIALELLKRDNNDALALSEAVKNIVSSVKECKVCHSFSEGDFCDICSSPARDTKILCIVEEAKEVYSIEDTAGYKGVYHVLKGKISPLDGIGPEQLTIKYLLERIKEKKFEEVIIATNSDVDGEATSIYLAEEIKPYGVKVSRIAFGLPVGGSLDYVDRDTISKALECRKEM